MDDPVQWPCINSISALFCPLFTSTRYAFQSTDEQASTRQNDFQKQATSEHLSVGLSPRLSLLSSLVNMLRTFKLWFLSAYTWCGRVAIRIISLTLTLERFQAHRLLPFVVLNLSRASRATGETIWSLWSRQASNRSKSRWTLGTFW